MGRVTVNIRGKKNLLLAAAMTAVPFFMLLPGFASGKQKAPFLKRNFAHRGLHTPDKTVPENSLLAFSLAVEAGYGIELDVQLSRDGHVVVFHDSTLNRVCGVDARVEEKTFPELKQLSLCGTEETVPLLTEVLALVHGREPLIVELKTGKRNRDLCEKTLALLRNYPGKFCIESFDPTIVAWFRFHAPEILRGQLANQPNEYPKALPRLLAALMGNTLMNFLGRPQFIAYKIGPRPVTTRLSCLLGAMNIGWTSHSRANETGRDAVIFEYYKPERVY